MNINIHKFIQNANKNHLYIRKQQAEKQQLTKHKSEKETGTTTKRVKKRFKKERSQDCHLLVDEVGAGGSSLGLAQAPAQVSRLPNLHHLGSVAHCERHLLRALNTQPTFPLTQQFYISTGEKDDPPSPTNPVLTMNATSLRLWTHNPHSAAAHHECHLLRALNTQPTLSGCSPWMPPSQGSEHTTHTQRLLTMNATFSGLWTHNPHSAAAPCEHHLNPQSTLSSCSIWMPPPQGSEHTPHSHSVHWWSRASCPQMLVDISGTNCDQCRSMVQYCFTSITRHKAQQFYIGTGRRTTPQPTQCSPPPQGSEHPPTPTGGRKTPNPSQHSNTHSFHTDTLPFLWGDWSMMLGLSRLMGTVGS